MLIKKLFKVLNRNNFKKVGWLFVIHNNQIALFQKNAVQVMTQNQTLNRKTTQSNRQKTVLQILSNTNQMMLKKTSKKRTESKLVIKRI